MDSVDVLSLMPRLRNEFTTYIDRGWTCVEIHESRFSEHEALTSWCVDQFGPLHLGLTERGWDRFFVLRTQVFYFDSAERAMLFKLRWC